MKLFTVIREYIHNSPRTKKVGVMLILVGLVALITPLTPGSWLAIIGLELLGVRMLFLDKLAKHLPPSSAGGLLVGRVWETLGFPVMLKS